MPSSHIGNRWRLVFCFTLRQWVERPLASIRHEAGRSPEPFLYDDCLLQWYGAPLSATKDLDMIALWHRMCVTAWERHNGRQAVVVFTRFLIPHRRQLRLVCICHRGTACLSTCQHLHSCHGLDTTFLGPNKNKCFMKQHFTLQPSLYGIESWLIPDKRRLKFAKQSSRNPLV
jgi:hypothetical protein